MMTFLKITKTKKKHKNSNKLKKLCTKASNEKIRKQTTVKIENNIKNSIFEIFKNINLK